MFGLLGKSLKYTLSPEIHRMLGDPDYQIWETSDLDQFMRTDEFSGLNVTIPYKEAIVPYLDALDGIAKVIGAVNTVVRREGKLIGYNTDYYGLFKLVQYHKITVKNKSVLIVGNGGAAKTATLLMRNLGAASVVKICRKPRMDDEIEFQALDSVLDFKIILNTTPVGVYPNNADSFIFPLISFKNLDTVIDLIYNPFKTNLLLEAETLKIKAVNGLYMLVAQAKASRELFLNDANIDHTLTKEIYDHLFRSRCNLVLIGLPLSGKSLYAELLGEKYRKQVIDSDAVIENESDMTINDIFEHKGEAYFRELESELVDRIYQTNGLVISTGGGMVMNGELMGKLRQNGIILYLDKDYHKIMEKKILNRPLIQSPADVERLAIIRQPYYSRYCDIHIDMNSKVPETMIEIEEKLNEYFSR